MKTYLLIPFSTIFLLFACQTQTGPTEVEVRLMDSIQGLHLQIDSLNQLTETKLAGIKVRSMADIERTEFLFAHPNELAAYRQPSYGVAVPWARIYDSRDSNAVLIDSLPFRTYLPRVSTDRQTYAVEYGNGKKGFLHPTDIYEYKVYAYEHHLEFLAGFSKATPYSKREVTIQVVSSKDRKQIISRHTLPLTLPYFHIKRAACALKGVDVLLVYSSNNASCPGTTKQIFLAFQQGKLKEITSTFSMGEEGDYNYQKIYFPARFENGKVVMLQDGNLQNIFNYVTGELNTFTVPEEIDIPLDDLVIVESESAHTEFDEDGRPVVDEKGNYALVKSGGITYYRWDGNKLTNIGQETTAGKMK